MEQQDILIEPDLKIENGDIVVGPADEQNSLYITFSPKGLLRLDPLLGVGIVNFTNARDISGRDLVKAINEEHDRDGYKVNSFEVKQEPDGSQEISTVISRIRL